MSLREAYTGVRIMETNDNYARADGPLVSQPQQHAGAPYSDYYYDDGHFWRQVLASPAHEDREIDFVGVSLSEWVPRVPGLFWTPEAETLRRLAEAKVSYTSNGWRVYHPPGKSEKVMGGIGTFRLPPAVDGTRLVTLTSTLNASAGVPALVTPEVWDKIGQAGPREGRVLRGRGRWQPMAVGWAERFRSTRKIPRGYLVLNDPAAIDTWGEVAPVQFHPFTVMEYYSGSKELFDYVFASGDTGSTRHRQRIADFFDAYRQNAGRHGKYLLACDMVDALWDADFDSPAALRHADLSAPSQLELLEARVRESLLGEDKIEPLLEVCGATSASPDHVRRLSLDIDIPPAIWQRGGAPAELCSQFLEAVVDRGKLEALVEVFALEFPHLIV
mgnify:CR=1 FL=1